MRVQRDALIVLLNALFDRGEETITIGHPADEIGELCHIDLGPHDGCRIRLPKDRETYNEARTEVARRHPETVADDIPKFDDFLNVFVAAGILALDNQDEIETFVRRYGDPDLMAGHSPVLAGFDTNLLPWRIGRMLGLHDPDEGIGYVNGFVLATGVRDELDWDFKCHDADPFVEAFGNSFKEYWNQPLGATRVGRLGLVQYRTIRDIEQATEIPCKTGDESIIEAYEEYDRAHRSDIILFSNDRTFVERAQAHNLLAHWVALPTDVPATGATPVLASWRQLEWLVYLLAIVFGVIELPSTTVYGVWRGKEGLDWQHERVRLDPRSPPLESRLEADLSIVESFEVATDR